MNLVLIFAHNKSFVSVQDQRWACQKNKNDAAIIRALANKKNIDGLKVPYSPLADYSASNIVLYANGYSDRKFF
jgi:hypothetical protein